MSQLTHHDRYDYNPIIGREDFNWPNDKRLAIYFGINHEVFSFGKGLGAQLAPSQTSPDVMNYAWRDYGNRVGAWRFLELFDKLSLRTTALMNGALIDKCPELAKACRDRGDEIAAHGMTNAEAQGHMSASEERAMIRRTLDLLEALDVRPTGWLGPWISESHRTPDLLKEAGFRYLLDWAHDDQPWAPPVDPVFSGDQRHSCNHRSKPGGRSFRHDDRGCGSAIVERVRSAPTGSGHCFASLCHGAIAPDPSSRPGAYEAEGRGRSTDLVDDSGRHR